MKKCPKCGKRTLQTADEEIKHAHKMSESIGDYFGRAPWITEDYWSCYKKRCLSCGYKK